MSETYCSRGDEACVDVECHRERINQARATIQRLTSALNLAKEGLGGLANRMEAAPCIASSADHHQCECVCPLFEETEKFARDTLSRIDEVIGKSDE